MIGHQPSSSSSTNNRDVTLLLATLTCTMLVNAHQVVNVQQSGNWSNVKNELQLNNKHQHRRIEFKPSSADKKSGQLASNTQNGQKPVVRADVSKSASHNIKKQENGLFDANIVSNFIQWKKVSRVGPGFFNDGNTCYLNSTLQCLMYTPALAQTMRSEAALVLKNFNRPAGNDHHQQQRSIIQHFQHLVEEVWSSPTGKTISPRSMVSNIRRVGKQFKMMRQEDAHEYLRQLLDCMHEEVLKVNGVKVSDGKIAETTVMSRIFGGYLCNTLTCSKCAYASRTFNHFQDMSLDITSGINSVSAALDHFTKSEILSHGNEWKCEQCKIKVKAKKQMTITTAPNVLVLHLKRFSFGNMSGKNTKQVDFKEHLSVQCGEAKVRYDLHGVVVHHGSSTHSGHYIAFVKAPTGQWHEMNDSRVTPVSIQKVLSCQAYILFYSKAQPAPSAAPAVPAAASETTVKVTGALAEATKVSTAVKPVDINEVGEVVPLDTLKALRLEQLKKSAAAAALASKAAALDEGFTSHSATSSVTSSMNIRPSTVTEPAEDDDEDSSDDSDFSEPDEDGDEEGGLASSFADLLSRQPYHSYQTPFRWRGGQLTKLNKWSSRGKGSLRLMVQANKRFADQFVRKSLVDEKREDNEEDCEEDCEEYSEGESDAAESVEKPAKAVEPVASQQYTERISKNVVLHNPSVFNGTDVVRGLIAQSNRSRDTGGEGMWDNVSAELAAEAKAIAVKQRRDEQKERNAKRPDLWSQKLDEGRVKKVKVKKDPVHADEGATGVNHFQQVQNDRGTDREAYFEAGSAVFEKKRKLGGGNDSAHAGNYNKFESGNKFKNGHNNNSSNSHSFNSDNKSGQHQGERRHSGDFNANKKFKR